MSRINIAITIGLVAIVLAGCGDREESCLPQGETAEVIRKGTDDGQRYVTLKRDNGEQVTCIGDTTPVLLSVGDRIDGWTMRKADATKPR